MNQTDHLVFPAYSFLEAGLILVCRLLNTHLLWEAVPPALHCPLSLCPPHPYTLLLLEHPKQLPSLAFALSLFPLAEMLLTWLCFSFHSGLCSTATFSKRLTLATLQKTVPLPLHSLPSPLTFLVGIHHYLTAYTFLFLCISC